MKTVLQELCKNTKKNTEKTFLNFLSWTLAASLGFGSSGLAANNDQPVDKTLKTEKTPPKSKSTFNTQIYEKENQLESFKDEVALVREMAGENQVKFKTHPGFYRLPEGDQTMQVRLVNAQTKHLKVEIEANSESKMIQKVTVDGM